MRVLVGCEGSRKIMFASIALTLDVSFKSISVRVLYVIIAADTFAATPSLLSPVMPLPQAIIIDSYRTHIICRAIKEQRIFIANIQWIETKVNSYKKKTLTEFEMLHMVFGNRLICNGACSCKCSYNLYAYIQWILTTYAMHIDIFPSIKCDTSGIYCAWCEIRTLRSFGLLSFLHRFSVCSEWRPRKLILDHVASLNLQTQSILILLTRKLNYRHSVFVYRFNIKMILYCNWRNRFFL